MTIILRVVGTFLSLFLVASFTLTSCMSFRATDGKVEKYFETSNDVNIHYVAFRDRQLRFVETNTSPKEKLPIVLFVHGAPGSSKDFYKYLKDSSLQTKAHMVALDRPGYGYSSYGKSLPSLEGQAAAVKKVLSYYDAKNVILVGHSYGSPIVGKVAMDEPERLDAIMMIAPVIDPESEKVFWYANFAKWGATNWALSKAFRVAGDEKFAHQDELRKIEDEWHEIDIPVVHIHGKKDKHLAPYGNVTFSKNHIDADVLNLIILDDAGHFIPWKNYDVVKKELIKLLEKQH